MVRMFEVTCPKLHVRFKVRGSVTVYNMLSRPACLQVPRVVGFSAEITWSCFGCWKERRKVRCLQISSYCLRFRYLGFGFPRRQTIIFNTFCLLWGSKLYSF